MCSLDAIKLITFQSVKLTSFFFFLGLIETRMSQLQAKANHSRICQLLIGKGGNAFRSVLQTKVNRSPPPSTLDSFLKANKIFLRNLRVVTPTQWDLLFPASGLPDSKDFDITLLTILLRNICGLASPASGWKVMPPAGDTSESAEILRIKMFRNEVYAHLPCPEIEDAEFERLWQEISKPLIKLGIPQQEIDDLKEAPLSSEEESYIQELKEWKEFEDGMITKMNDLGEEIGVVKKKITDVEDKVDFVKEKVNNMSDSISHVENEVVKLQTNNAKVTGIEKLAKFEFKGKSEELRKKFQEGTRKWFFDRFKNWLDDENSRVMILTAGPGVGKSVLSAKICELYEESSQLAACHFCDFRTSDYRDPHRILESLASQMCDNVDGFREKLAEALSRKHSRNSLSDAFRVLQNDPLHALDRSEPMLIVVDALDESKTANKSEILELISEEFSRLPKWIKIFITSRPELQVKKTLHDLNPLEILPDDYRQRSDLEHFIQRSLRFLDNKPDILDSLLEKCNGSFLYAYYLVNEVKKLGVEQDVVWYVPQGISGFYEKQFKRLKKELQSYERNTEVSIIFESFVNVIAASKAPLPFTILLTCMDLSDKKYEIREMIVGIMSEILPVYDDCLTVFHKSLRDWLTLNGHKEHVFAADVADGKKRLWRACKKVYADIYSLSSVSNFQISAERRYALENGLKYFVNVDGTEDWEWLVNVKVNYFKFSSSWYPYLLLNRLSEIFEEYKSRIPGDVFLHLIQLYTFLKIHDATHQDKPVSNMYLKYYANKQSTASKMIAREMLNQIDTVWLEEVTNETDSSFKMISYTFLKNSSLLMTAISASPDNKLLVMRGKDQVKVYELPSLKRIFKLDLNKLSDAYWQCILFSSCIVFSPDSSYFLVNSLQTCVSIKNQSLVPFIPHGPAEIISSSFSSCGTKLVSVEKRSIKVWDVTKTELLKESGRDFNVYRPITSFSACMSYIFLFDCIGRQLNVFDSTALNLIETATNVTCLTKLDDCIQLISPRSRCFKTDSVFNLECWQLTTGQNILCTATKHCSTPFVWKGRKCVLTSYATSALVVYDYLNQQVIDTFQISSLPSSDVINYIANLGENNFLFCVKDYILFVLSLESSSGFPAFSFINDFIYPIIYALSPDNLYVACSYGSPILRIMNVDNGETLQTVAPKQKPLACWWSDLYLWVVCEGSVVVKYPYISTHRNVVGNDAEECSIDCDDDVLKFEEGVLVCREVNRKISISKICGKNLSRQQILDSKIGRFCKVAISSDGCAVLLYDKYDSYLFDPYSSRLYETDRSRLYETDRSCLYGTDLSRLYELWEMGSENKWELHSTGKLNPLTDRGCLAGKQNSRCLFWLFRQDFDLRTTSAVRSIDFSDPTPESIVHQLPIKLSMHPDVIYVDCKLLMCLDCPHIHFIHVPDGTVITSLYVGEIRRSFFVPSKRLLFLFIGNGIIKHFKIHNIDKYLPSK